MPGSLKLDVFNAGYRPVHDFDEAVAASSSGQEVVSRMTAKYPDLGNPYTLWLAAYTQRYGRCSHGSSGGPP